jgi:hypothetical protein
MNTPYPILNFGLGEEVDLLRDAKLYEIGAGTSEVRRIKKIPLIVGVWFSRLSSNLSCSEPHTNLI